MNIRHQIVCALSSGIREVGRFVRVRSGPQGRCLLDPLALHAEPRIDWGLPE